MKERKRKSRFPLARIKKIMQSNEEIGKLGVSAPVVMGRATEMFLKELVKNAINEVKENKKTKLTIEDVKKVIDNVSKYDFLRLILSEEGV